MEQYELCLYFVVIGLVRFYKCDVVCCVFAPCDPGLLTLGVGHDSADGMLFRQSGRKYMMCHCCNSMILWSWTPAGIFLFVFFKYTL